MPCRNAAETLAEQLEALASQTYRGEWQLVLVDNGSTDGTRRIAHAYHGRLDLTVVNALERQSPGYARNCGVGAARGERIVFVDADDVAAPTFLAGMEDALRSHDVVVGRAELGRLNEPWARARQEIEGLPRLPFPPYLAIGSCFALGVRRELHEAIGGFDDTVPALDDVDYSIRLQLAGGRLHYEPSAVVHYRYRKTLGGIFSQAAAYAADFALLEKRYRTARARRLLTWPLRGWKGILRELPAAGTRAGRARLAWYTGWQVGRLRGSIRHRVAAG